MRNSGTVIILVMVGLVLASGCTSLSQKKTSDSTTTGTPGSQALSHGGNAASALVKPWYVKALIFNKTPKVPVRLTGIQPAGRQRSGKVSSHVSGSLAMGCQSQPATFAASGRLFSEIPQLNVRP